MPFRGSLTKCTQAAAERLGHGTSSLAIITASRTNKYYTLYHASEYEARLLNKPDAQDRLVLACTGGELAAIVGAVNTQLTLLEN